MPKLRKFYANYANFTQNTQILRQIRQIRKNLSKLRKNLRKIRKNLRKIRKGYSTSEWLGSPRGEGSSTLILRKIRKIYAQTQNLQKIRKIDPKYANFTHKKRKTLPE